MKTQRLIEMKPCSWEYEVSVDEDYKSAEWTKVKVGVGEKFPSDEVIGKDIQSKYSSDDWSILASDNYSNSKPSPPPLTRLVVPEEFRQSRFGSSWFSIDHDAKPTIKRKDMLECYGRYRCCFHPSIFTSKFSEDIERFLEESDKDSFTFPTYRKRICSTCKKKGKKLEFWITAERIPGMPVIENIVCTSCKDKHSLLSTLKVLTQEGDINLSVDILHMIRDYLKFPLHYQCLLSPEENDYECSILDRHGTFLDWVEFLHLAQDEDTIFYLINCNLDSSFYGYILKFDCQGDDL